LLEIVGAITIITMYYFCSHNRQPSTESSS